MKSREIVEQINHSIEKSKAEKDALKQELVEAKKIKAMKQEFEDIAAEINRYPSQEESYRKIEECEKQCLEFKKKQGDEKLVRVEKKARLLVSLLQDLKEEAGRMDID